MSAWPEEDVPDNDERVGWAGVALFAMFHAIFAFLAVAFVWFGAMRVAACGQRCDFAGAYAAMLLMFWGSIAVVVGTTGTLLVLRKRQWSNWPIAASGIVLVFLLAVLCWYLQGRAFGL